MIGILALILFLVFYPIPTYAAFHAHSKHRAGIALINIALGWTIIGWIGALIWAMYDEEEGR